MNLIKNVWEFLNGRKTTIGATVAFIVGGAYFIGVVDQTVFDQVMMYNLIIFGVGLGHKGFKQFVK